MTQENRLREAREIINTIDRHTIESQYGFAELEKRIVESLIQAEKRGFERAREMSVKVADNHWARQFPQSGFSRASKSISSDILKITYEGAKDDGE